MPSLSSIFNFKRSNPLAGIILFALCVAGIEATLALLPQNSLITSFRAHRLPSTSPDWQIMGDSVAAGGINAGQLASHLTPQTNVVNLALSGTGPEFPYFILKRELAAGAPPKAIIYAPSPHTFGTDRVGLLVGAYATWPEIAEIAGSGIKPFEVFYGVLCKLSYSLRHREQLAEALKGRRMPEGIEHVTSNQSGNTLEKDSPHFSLSNVHPMYRKPFTVDPFNDHFAKKFLMEAKANGIPVYWVKMPVLNVISEVRQNFQFDEDYQKFLKMNQKDYGIILPTQENLIMEDGNFLDYTHLNSRGAELFTDHLGVLMNKAKTAQPAPNAHLKISGN